MSLSNPPKDTPTNTSLREELKSIAYSSEVKPTGWQSIYVDESGRWDKYVFNLDDLVALLTAKTTEAIEETWNYTGEGYNGEYDGLTHIGGKRYTYEEVMAKVKADVLERLQHPTKGKGVSLN